MNQHHYYLAPPPVPAGLQRPHTSGGALSKLGLGSDLGSLVNMTADLIPMDLPRVSHDGHLDWRPYGTPMLAQGAALCDQISSAFDNVMSMVEQDRYKGNEGELFTFGPSSAQQVDMPLALPAKDEGSHRRRAKAPSPPQKHQPKGKGQTTAVAAAVISASYFSKVHLYANSRLPMNLPPLSLYGGTPSLHPPPEVAAPPC